MYLPFTTTAGSSFNTITTPNKRIADPNIKVMKTKFLLFCLLTSAFCLCAAAQSYSIDWYTIDGGGGTSTGGTYSVSGTIGQPDAGAMSGDSYTLQGGFWALISVVQTPGAPLLTITCSGNSVIVSWPSSFPDWALEQNSNLAPPGWTPTSYYIVNINGTNSITIALPTGNLFFRLSK
jgi:hypothetical protein